MATWPLPKNLQSPSVPPLLVNPNDVRMDLIKDKQWFIDHFWSEIRNTKDYNFFVQLTNMTWWPWSSADLNFIKKIWGSIDLYNMLFQSLDDSWNDWQLKKSIDSFIDKYNFAVKAGLIYDEKLSRKYLSEFTQSPNLYIDKWPETVQRVLQNKNLWLSESATKSYLELLDKSTKSLHQQYTNYFRNGAINDFEPWIKDVLIKDIANNVYGQNYNVDSLMQYYKDKWFIKTSWLSDVPEDLSDTLPDVPEGLSELDAFEYNKEQDKINRETEQSNFNAKMDADKDALKQELDAAAKQAELNRQHALNLSKTESAAASADRAKELQAAKDQMAYAYEQSAYKGRNLWFDSSWGKARFWLVQNPNYLNKDQERLLKDRWFIL